MVIRSAMIMSNVNKVKHPLGMHNTYWPVASLDASSTERAKESVVHPFMVPLIEAIQLKRPHWEFEATGFGDRDITTGHVRHYTFDIIDNGEKLGSIYREYRGSSNVYAAKSHRIAGKRQIGMSKMSKHLKTIVSEVLKEMYPRTVAEIADDKYKTSYQAMQQATYKDKRAHMHTVDILRDSMLAYLTSGDRWAEFEAAPDKPSAMQAKSTYITVADNAGVADDIARSDHVVLVERPRDVIIKPANSAAYACSLELLPDDTKTKFALLKMAETNTILADVGIRTADDTFYILTKKEA
jgi:hypothetical protein